MAHRPAVFVAIVGLLMTLTQAPASAAVGAPAPAPAPAAPMAGELFYLKGSVPVDSVTPASRTVLLQQLESDGRYRTLRSVSSEPDGDYALPARITKATRFRVTSKGVGTLDAVVSTSRRVEVASQFVWATAKRVCNPYSGVGTKCVDTVEVSGYVRPAREGRLVRLQIRTSGGWQYLSGPRGRTDGDGNFAMTFGIRGWAQWSARQLRAVAQGHNGATYAFSAPMSFMPGPTQLGKNVLRIDVAGGRFPQTKGVDHTGYATLTQNGSPLVTRARLDKFGVRGSSTAKFAKKPYNLRFDKDPGTGNEVFGMKADRSWTLLAMFIDQSFVRDKTALDLGRQLSGMTWNPDSEYVELFVNSEYRGAYLLTEKVKLDDDRVAVDEDTGMIMEVDGRTVSDPTLGFVGARSGQVFAFKEPDHYDRKPDGSYDSEGVTPAKLSAIKNKVAQVENYLYTSKRKYYYQHIDRDSAADFYLAMEFFKDNDSDFWRSKYFTWDRDIGNCGNELCDGKLHFGPLWDFDRGAGNQTGTSAGATYVRSPYGWNANGKGIGYSDRPTYTKHWYVQLWKVPMFVNDLKTRWNDPTIREAFRQTFATEVDANKALIGVGASNDRKRWVNEPKWYKPKGPSYNDEVNYVKSWLTKRFGWMDRQL